MSPLDLIRDAGTGQLSHTKLWANVAYAATTVAIVKSAWAGTLTADLLWPYLVVVGASTAASKLLSLRCGQGAGG